MNKFTQHITHPVFNIIADTAQELNYPCYVIGGYVRNVLLAHSCKDIDIVCVGKGIEFAKAVAKNLDKKIKVQVFTRFGTAMFKYKNMDIEFVGARKESYRSNSRNPVVEDGSFEDDQNRRDFTINAMSISLNKQDYGNLIDPFNGLKDLKDKIIRTPLNPDITFSDDPLRMLRAIRFASQLDFNIEAATFSAIKKNKQRIRIISQERITDELNKIILSPQPSAGFILLSDSGLLEIIIPEVAALKGTEVINEQAHKDNFNHTLQVLDNVAKVSEDLWLRWSAVLHDIAKPKTKRFNRTTGWTFHGHDAIGAKMVTQIFSKLRLPANGKMKFVKKMVALHLRPISLAQKAVTDSGIRRLLFDTGKDIDALMILCRADITSKNEMRVKRYLSNFDRVEQRLKEVEEKDRIRNWQPPISGEVIMGTFNLHPCKEIGIIKTAICDAILDGVIPNTYEAAHSFMLKKGKEMGLKAGIKTSSAKKNE